MAIFYDYTITVDGDKAKLDKNIYLYKNNKNIIYYFKIQNAPFKFINAVDMVESLNASTADIKILKPNGVKKRIKNIPIENGKVKLEIDDSFMDEISEIGKYTFQIDLYDNATNKGRVTIPPVIEQFCVLAPIFEDNEATE